MGEIRHTRTHAYCGFEVFAKVKRPLPSAKSIKDFIPSNVSGLLKPFTIDSHTAIDARIYVVIVFLDSLLIPKGARLITK